MSDRPRAALVVLTRDDDLRDSVARELDRRYGRDYAVLAADGPAAATAMIGQREGLPVAALLGGFGGADPDGLVCLRAAPGPFRRGRRRGGPVG